MRRGRQMLRAAVIGVGEMGQHHARVYSDLEGVLLVSVADCQMDVAERVARRHGGKAYADYAQMFDEEQIDVATVAVPTTLHYRVASEVIQRGIHLLVEKPLARQVEKAAEIVEMAQRHGVMLTVGHIERFNPAVIELKRRLDAGEIGRVFHLNVRRWSPYPKRIRDVGVVLDMATHDLDIMGYLVGDEVERLYAEGDFLFSLPSEDSISAFLRFRNGALGMLDVNWVTPCKVRELSITGQQGMITLDYLDQELFIYRNGRVTSEWGRLSLFTGVSEGDMVRPAIAKREPLRVELESFVRAVVEGTPAPVTGEDALRVVRLAQALVDSARTHQPIVMP